MRGGVLAEAGFADRLVGGLLDCGFVEVGATALPVPGQGLLDATALECDPRAGIELLRSALPSKLTLEQVPAGRVQLGSHPSFRPCSVRFSMSFLAKMCGSTSPR